jgi:hypothetical protein
MKIKYNFVVREVADKMVAIAVEDNPDCFNGMLTLNDSGAFIFKLLQSGADMKTLIAEFLKEYDATREQAEKTITNFVDKLREVNLIEE